MACVQLKQYQVIIIISITITCETTSPVMKCLTLTLPRIIDLLQPCDECVLTMHVDAKCYSQCGLYRSNKSTFRQIKGTRY